MIERYFTEPYRFVPPYRGRFWCHIGWRLLGRQLRNEHRVMCWRFEGVEHLRASLDENAGILLTVNHCRWADPLLMGLLGVEAQEYFYYLVSYHLFRQGRLLAWWLRRLGSYSVWREGADRESLRESARILATAERPLVVYPEGTWFRQNDRLGPLQEGLGLMLRQASKQTDRPLRVHPVAIKYWFLEDPRPELCRRLAALEAGLSWQPQEQLELVARIEKLGTALIAIKEIEFFGAAQSGGLDERISNYCDARVSSYEKAYLGRTHEGWVLERVRRLRLHLNRRLIDTQNDATEHARVRQSLDALLLCENLNAHSLEYLHERPGFERLTETVQRIEETVHDRPEIPVGRCGAVVQVGPALDGRQTEALVPAVAAGIQQGLDRLVAQGVPAEWQPAHDPYRAPLQGV